MASAVAPLSLAACGPPSMVAESIDDSKETAFQGKGPEPELTN
jgi:hypothetical protein